MKKAIVIALLILGLLALVSGSVSAYHMMYYPNPYYGGYGYYNYYQYPYSYPYYYNYQPYSGNVIWIWNF